MAEKVDQMDPDAFLELYKYHNRNFYADSSNFIIITISALQITDKVLK